LGGTEWGGKASDSYALLGGSLMLQFSSKGSWERTGYVRCHPVGTKKTKGSKREKFEVETKMLGGIHALHGKQLFEGGQKKGKEL